MRSQLRRAIEQAIRYLDEIHQLADMPGRTDVADDLTKALKAYDDEQEATRRRLAEYAARPRDFMDEEPPA